MSSISRRRENKIKASIGVNNEHPLCFISREQYVEWLTYESIVPTQNFRRNICEDCTKDYQKSMISANRCVNPRILLP